MTVPTAPQLLYAAAGRPEIPYVSHQTAQCFMCGYVADEVIPANKAILSSFTNLDLMRGGSREWVCVPCAHSLTDQAVHPDGRTFRMRLLSHLVVNGEWLAVQRKERHIIRKALSEPPDGLWFAAIAESAQKHIIFRAPVNLHPDVFRVQWEETNLPLQRDAFRNLCERVDQFRRDGFILSEIVTGAVKTSRLKRLGSSGIKALAEAFGRLHNTRLLALAGFLSAAPEGKERA